MKSRFQIYAFVLALVLPPWVSAAAPSPEEMQLRAALGFFERLTNYSVTFEARNFTKSGVATNRHETKVISAPYFVWSRESLRPDMVRIFTHDMFYERFDDQKVFFRCRMNDKTTAKIQQGALLALQAAYFQGWAYLSSFAAWPLEKWATAKGHLFFVLNMTPPGAKEKSYAVLETDTDISRVYKMFILKKIPDFKSLNHGSEEVLTSGEWTRFQEVNEVGFIPTSLRIFEKGRLSYESDILALKLGENVFERLRQTEIADLEKKYSVKDLQ